MVNRMDEILQKVNELPLLPSVTTQILKMTDDPDTTVVDLERVICQDEALAAQVLKLANSAYYGFPRRVTTITKAVVILGFHAIRGIVLAASAYPYLDKPMEGYALEKGELWQHAMAVATCSRLIAKKVKYKDQNEAFAAGLLHDIGKIILNTYVKDQFIEIVEKVETEQITYSQAEKKILGFNHAELGAKVGEKWNLPSRLINAIAFHHDPEQGDDDDQLTYIVHLADVICSMLGIGIGNDELLYSVSGKAIEVFGFGQNDIDMLISEMNEFLADADNLIEI